MSGKAGVNKCSAVMVSSFFCYPLFPHKTMAIWNEKKRTKRIALKKFTLARYKIKK